MDIKSGTRRFGGMLAAILLSFAATLAASSASLAQTPEESPQRKSPPLALALSVVVPGGGQAYNGEWGKSAVVFGTVVAGVGLFGSDLAICLWDDDGENCTRAAVGMAVTGLVLLYSLIDAPLTARSINRRRSLGDIDITVGPSFGGASGPKRRGFGDLNLIRLTF